MVGYGVIRYSCTIIGLVLFDIHIVIRGSIYALIPHPTQRFVWICWVCAGYPFAHIHLTHYKYETTLSLCVQYQSEKQRPWVSRHKGAIQILGITTVCVSLFVVWPLYWGYHLYESTREGVVGIKAMSTGLWSEECVALYPSLTSSDDYERCWFTGNYDLDSIPMGALCKISQVGMDIVLVSCQKP